MNMKSPCLSCELKDEDKNNPTCEACTKRILYDKSLGPPTASMPENVNMDGDAGTKIEIEDSKEQTDFDSVEEYIRYMCDDSDNLVIRLKHNKKDKYISKLRREVAFGLKEKFKITDAIER